MKGSVGSKIQDTSSAMETLTGTFLNKRYFQVLRAINWSNVDYEYEFTTVSGTQNYALPDDFGKEVSVRDTTTGVELARVDYSDLVANYPDGVADSGSPARYVIYEDVVKVQPASALAITMVSSSSVDTTQTVLVRGISGGVETTTTVTLLGANTATTTVTYTRIKGISKSGVTTGTVTVSAGAVTIAVMAPKVTESRYRLIKLHYVPTTALVISVPYIIKPLPMTENNDYPCLDIADLLEVGAEADAWFYKRQAGKSSVKEMQFNVELQQYIFSNESQPNMVITFKPITYNKDSLY